MQKTAIGWWRGPALQKLWMTVCFVSGASLTYSIVYHCDRIGGAFMYCTLVVLSYLALLSGEQDSCQDGRDFVLGNVIGIEEESRPRVARRTRPMHGRESAVDSYEVLCWRVG